MQPINKKIIVALRQNYIKYRSLRKVSVILHISPNTVKKYLPKNVGIRSPNIVQGVKSEDELLLGAYVGIWMGDGTQYFDNGFCIKICCNKSNRLLNNLIKSIILHLFGKKSNLNEVSHTNQAYVKFYSKFIFEFIYSYVEHGVNKTHSVHLKNEVSFYSKEFLKGVILGLVLTDGYIKDRLVLSVTSPRLARNAIDILVKMGFHPTQYVHRRKKYGWKDLFMVRLNKEESLILQMLLNSCIEKLNCSRTILELKYYKKFNEPGRI